MDLSGLSAYVKFGGESLLGFVPPKISAIAAKLERTGVPSRRICDEKVSLSLKEMITDTFNRVSLDLVKAHTDYRKKEIKAEKDRAIHGSLTEEKQAELDYAKRLFEKLLSVTTTLSETIDMPLPVLEVTLCSQLEFLLLHVLQTIRWKRTKRTRLAKDSLFGMVLESWENKMAEYLVI